MYRIFKICIFLICMFNDFCFIQTLSADHLRHKPTNKLTLAEWPSYNIQNPNGPGTYAYGYEIDDPISKNVQFRDEEKLSNGTVQGSYGIVRTNGMVTLTRYTSDSAGYRAKTQTFNQNDIKATIITTESPKDSQMPNGIGYLDLNPETSKDVSQQVSESDTIPENVAQQILAEQDRNHMNLSEIYYSPNNIPVTSSILLDRIDNLYDRQDNDDNDEDPDLNGNLETLQTILSPQNPIIITTTKDDKNHTVGIQFINNYIPHNVQLLPFFITKRNKPIKPNDDTPKPNDFYDPVFDDNKPFVNDKFHDPLDDFRNLNIQKTNQMVIGKRKILTNQNQRKFISGRRHQQEPKLKIFKNYKLNNKQQDNI